MIFTRYEPAVFDNSWAVLDRNSGKVWQAESKDDAQMRAEVLQRQYNEDLREGEKHYHQAV